MTYLYIRISQYIVSTNIRMFGVPTIILCNCRPADPQIYPLFFEKLFPNNLVLSLFFKKKIIRKFGQNVYEEIG